MTASVHILFNALTFNNATVPFFRLFLKHETKSQPTASIIKVQIHVSATSRFFVLCSLGRIPTVYRC